MDRRHQVFISSTFIDLEEERKEITQTLLEMDCIPSGMEMFPAANDDQWTLIKRVIDECDYYLIVVGGRYGSVSEEGISYTEREYDYAISRKIPVMGFVPSHPDVIPLGKTDRNDAAAARLEAFKVKVQSRMTKDYNGPQDLAGKVARSLSQLRKSNPQPGWVRGDQAMTPETRARMAELEAEVERLKRIRAEESAIPSATEIDPSFQHGTDTVKLSWTFDGGPRHARKRVEESTAYKWDEIIQVIGPFMIDEAAEDSLRSTLSAHMSRPVYQRNTSWPTMPDITFNITDKAWGDVIVQLRALRMIETGAKKRSTTIKSVYWKLTPAGDAYLVNLRAARR
ncbi:uncharacterized protein DUF4062 [Glaciihabitans tibetensis]|uniref:Uncharacterized protein DUF4062 n=1 Tax=Glaciihabitans tibetensis TaxID=1266600 RepID=A0A2T0V5E1_9MICO|nr:DUF4062 domain-containing protein [Glaciihabitans tibetensis]PRY65402.1 uncharacterized protein DUF4062 [Glaciihabitans tibetensis]